MLYLVAWFGFSVLWLPELAGWVYSFWWVYGWMRREIIRLQAAAWYNLVVGGVEVVEHEYGELDQSRRERESRWCDDGGCTWRIDA